LTKRYRGSIIQIEENVMKHTDQEIAARLVMADAPKLSTQDVAEYLDIKSVTLRSWITREYIRLHDAERGSAGRGKSSFFSPIDIIQLIACAKMTRFSIVPGFLTAKFSADVSAHVLGNLHIIAKTQGYEEEQRQIISDYYDKQIAGYKALGMPDDALSVVYKNKQEAINREISPRFLGITYSPLMKQFFSIPFEGNMEASGGIFSDPTHLVFDCLDIADKLIEAYRAYGTI
jgi:hypothetical protein